MEKQYGGEMVMNMFHQMVKRVPAYAQFLEENGVDHASVKTLEDVHALPWMHKKNYLKKYSQNDVLWDGNPHQPFVLTSTSGSTGTPFFFPRGRALDRQYADMLDRYLQQDTDAKTKSTLVIICFGMGVWIGGLITYSAFEIAANEHEYPLSIITPGINKSQILGILTDLAPRYEQVILVGYPPFIKDVVDAAQTDNLFANIPKVRLLFAAESFTESFRDYLHERLPNSDPYRDSANIYGSADIGAMAIETPMTICIRRVASQHPALFQQLFGAIDRMPTLAQYDPAVIHFTAIDGELLLSGDNAIPLMQYQIGDQGGVFDFDELVQIMKDYGVDILKECRKAGIEDTVMEFPFVYVHERSDFAVSYYGINVYPQPVKHVLLQEAFADVCTGRFTVTIQLNETQDQFMEVNVELKAGYTLEDGKAITKKLQTAIVAALSHASSEFRELSVYLQERIQPSIVFWEYGDETYFTEGIKQKWTI